MKGYGQVIAPLTTLLKRDSFAWTIKASHAFQLLKDAMSNPSVLALPDYTKPFIVESDASKLGLCVFLMQNHRPIAFHSQALKGKNLALSTYEKELLALVVAVNTRPQKNEESSLGLCSTTCRGDAPACEGARWRSLLKMDVAWCAHVYCVAWLSRASGAFSLSVEEGRSNFGVMAGFWAKF